MNTQSNAMPGAFGVSGQVAPPIAKTRLFYWLVRRELWEHRSIYIAPVAAAGVVLFGFLISLVHLPGRMRAIIAMRFHGTTRGHRTALHDGGRLPDVDCHAGRGFLFH